MKLIKSFKFLRPIIRKLKIGSFEFRLNMNSLKRMQYAYICFNAAKLGKQLGYKKISILEYGVAGGQGLLILEQHVEEIEKFFKDQKIKTSTVLLPLQGDQRAAADYWNLALQSGGTTISPSKDWP